jgi:starch-binding outer membrane protein, SusD/RagB family
MKKKYIILLLIVALLGTWGSCKSDFLTVSPAGSLDQTLLQTTKGLDALLVGAYSILDGATSIIGSWEASGVNWVWGSIRGMEANKGTDSGDQPDINPLQTYNETATNSYLDAKWRMSYEAISRCNAVITITNKALAAGKIDQTAADLYVNQAKVLRGWYHFDAWRIWTKIPYMDETTDPAKVKNDVDAAPKFLADLQAGLSLPLNMGAIGKWNKTVAEVVYAKALMQVNHDYAGAKTQLLDVIATGVKPNGAAIGLAPTYGEIFAIENRNGPESVYTVQYSVNDGSGAWNGGYGEQLNFPYKSGGSPGGCCGFFDPTQEFVNTFRTVGGLPIPNFGYNAVPVKNDFGIAVTAAYTPDAGLLDPRLDWAVGRRGIPYWDWGLHTGADWIRDQTYSGPYSPKKEVYKKSQQGTYTEVGYWTSGITSNGYRFIRYADVLLLLAECQIETNDLAGATANINKVRARAANNAGWVTMPDGTFAANYSIAVYPATFATQADARYALQIERKLELGQEGHRFFDLQRWGNAQTEINRMLTYEKTMPWGNSLYGSATFGPEDVNFPIPQRQIDISNGNLVQNR